MDLENAEEILQILERYTKQKPKSIPEQLNGYLSHVALTGDSVYSWPKVQYFFREKLVYVLKDFHDTTPRTEDLPISRNVDPFNYDTMKTTLLERFDLFNAAPFTIQRLSELLSEPKKHYCRLDKFMRALEKNILVVSTVEPGHRTMGSENGDSINGDPLMDINVDVEMDKEPSGSCVPSVEEKVEQPDSISDESTTETKTEPETNDGCDEAITDDTKASTNGHHSSDELNDTIEDVKDDEAVDSSNAVESVTVDIQLAAKPDEKVNLPEETVAVSQPTLEASPATSDVEQPKEPLAEAVAEKVVSETDSVRQSSAAKSVDESETSVEKKPEKHLLDRDDDDDEDDDQPTAAKLAKIDESSVSTEAVSGASKVDVATIDTIPTDDAVLSSDDQPTDEVKEPLSEAVLLEENSETEDSVETAPLAIPSIGDETSTTSESVVVDEPIVDKRIDDDAAVTIPTDTEPPLQPDAVDDPNSDTTSTDNTISPLASTLSNNDLDVLEDEEELDEDALIEPIVADTEQSLLDSPVALPETDVEMTPSVDSAEQMAVEDPVQPVLAATNSDSAMDATQIIPPVDEQMEVLENNSMDQDL